LVISFASSVFVNVQVIVSPGSGANVAVAEFAPTECVESVPPALSPVQSTLVDQPGCSASDELKVWPAGKDVIVRELVSVSPRLSGEVASALPVNVNSVFGCVAELTILRVMIVAAFLLVNVQVVSSPGLTRTLTSPTAV
jgi:hypothetical protein